MNINLKPYRTLILLVSTTILLILLIAKPNALHMAPNYHRIILDHYFQRAILVNEHRMAFKGISLLNTTLGVPLRKYYKEEYPEEKVYPDASKQFDALSRTKQQKLLTLLDVGSHDLISGFNRNIIIPAEMPLNYYLFTACEVSQEDSSLANLALFFKKLKSIYEQKTRKSPSDETYPKIITALPLEERLELFDQLNLESLNAIEAYRIKETEKIKQEIAEYHHSFEKGIKKSLKD